jgi:iron complex transport system substrate-binding protein
MRTVVLEPFLAELVHYLNGVAELVGIPLGCREELVKELPHAECICGAHGEYSGEFASEKVLLSRIAALSPAIILGALSPKRAALAVQQFSIALSAYGGVSPEVHAFPIGGFETMLNGIHHIGDLVGKPHEATGLTGRFRAQIMTWCDNFHGRMRNKKVTVISSISPLRLAGTWIPDIVRLSSAHPQHMADSDGDVETTWNEILQFRPDVMLLAPRGYSLQETVKTLPLLSRVPAWEDIPAVKRGEVVFADGFGLYEPGPRFLEGVSILLSAVAGFESGYISTRDLFYRLRYIELHRHRF